MDIFFNKSTITAITPVVREQARARHWFNFPTKNALTFRWRRVRVVFDLASIRFQLSCLWGMGEGKDTFRENHLARSFVKSEMFFSIVLSSFGGTSIFILQWLYTNLNHNSSSENEIAVVWVFFTIFKDNLQRFFYFCCWKVISQV